MSNPETTQDSTTGYPDRFPDAISKVPTAGVRKTFSLEELRTEHSSFYSEELPPRPLAQSADVPWRQRMRRFFTFSLSSYNVFHTANRAARLRHVAMITILVLRTAMSGLSVASEVIKWNVGGIILYSFLAVLTFWFTATCLAIIGDAAGDEQIQTVIFKRWHLDVFIGLCVVIHIGLTVAWFFGLTGWGLELTSIGMWLAILGVAWLVGWQPELPSYHRSWAT